MVIRIALIVLNLAGFLALIIGLLFWTGTAQNLVSLHMLLGFLTIGALWIIGIGQALDKGGSWIIAALALALGAAAGYFGMIQSSLFAGESHWVIEVSHLLLGLLTIGLGHMGAARHRKSREKSRPSIREGIRPR
jgi:hypothetical protein